MRDNKWATFTAMNEALLISEEDSGIPSVLLGIEVYCYLAEENLKWDLEALGFTLEEAEKLSQGE